MKLAILRGGSRPSSVTTSAGEVERAWAALCVAADDYGSSPLGQTDALFERKDAWVKAMNEYERARRALKMAISRSEGRSGLVCLGGGKP